MLKIKDLRKKYDDFSLNCSLEIIPGCITGLADKMVPYKDYLKRLNGRGIENV